MLGKCAKTYASTCLSPLVQHAVRVAERHKFSCALHRDHCPTMCQISSDGRCGGGGVVLEHVQGPEDVVDIGLSSEMAGQSIEKSSYLLGQMGVS